MKHQLPLKADDIDVQWHIDEGGIGVTASTDEAGLPYIGLYSINRRGDPIGLPLSLQHQRLMCRIVAGYDRRCPIVVFIDAHVTPRGLEVRFMPPPLIKQRGYDNHKFVAWGGEGPRYHFTICPANSNRPFSNQPFMSEVTDEPSTAMETGSAPCYR